MNKSRSLTVRFVPQSAERIDEKDILKKIEICGRVCYKSEDKIKEGSALAFYEKIVKNGHHSVLEHVRISMRRLFCKETPRSSYLSEFEKYMLIFEGMEYREVTVQDEKALEISGNLRSWAILLNQTWNDPTFGSIAKKIEINYVVRELCRIFPEFDRLLSFSTTAMKTHAGMIAGHSYVFEQDTKYSTFRFVTDRGISHELVRHRLASFSQESTRYCNYGEEITFIEYDSDTIKKSMLLSAQAYECLLNQGLSPQMARSVLPNGLKTELIMTATDDQWKYIRSLRESKAAHPMVRELMELAFSPKITNVRISTTKKYATKYLDLTFTV
ncbi:MAG TPA: FAD-dependent thymidylate synthase [Saccharofermentans sp.]|nr:FAD-dependent thymidylate synthase [Saccharofermentans sp.]